MEIVNGSGWPITESIKIKNKTALLQQLLLDELIQKRKAALDEVRQGLKISCVLDIICSHRDIFEEVFLYRNAPVTYRYIKEMILKTSRRPEDYPMNQAFDFFMDFISGNAQLFSFAGDIKKSICLQHFKVTLPCKNKV